MADVNDALVILTAIGTFLESIDTDALAVIANALLMISS